jgi:tetratricopeptide (TPR) repeat protein
VNEHPYGDPLRRETREAIWSGDYRRALATAEQGLALARQQGDRRAEELFLCNRATIWTEKGNHDFPLGALEEIILGSSSRYNAALASYVVAGAEDRRGRFARAESYARTSLRKSEEIGDAELMGSSLSLLGRLEMQRSRFDRAREDSLKSLDVLEEHADLAPMTAMAADQLGYCCIVLGEVEAGFAYLERSLATLAGLGFRQAMDYPFLDMCYARLTNGDLEEAESWGCEALAVGEEFGREEIIKNAHYLLAESSWRRGRRSDAEDHYDALARYYPGFPKLKDYLRQVDLTSVINLL